MEDLERIAETVGKLLEMHRRDPNSPEGKNAFSKALTLMNKHSIEEKDIDRGLIVRGESEIVKTKDFKRRDLKLLCTLGKYNGVLITFRHYKNLTSYCMTGRKINKKVLILLFDYVREYVNRVLTQFKTEAERDAYMQIFTAKLAVRIEDEQSTWAFKESSDSRELVLASEYKEVTDWFKSNVAKLTSVTINEGAVKRVSQDAFQNMYNSAVHTAKNIPLNPQIKAEPLRLT